LKEKPETASVANELQDLKRGIITLNARMLNLEQMIGTGFKNLLSLASERRGFQGSLDINGDVEIERTHGPEDSLTPHDIFILPGPLKSTATELIRLRITTADEISEKTRRERAVESGYLNQLVKLNYCRKFRIGRKIFFSIGNRRELMPLLNLKKAWRDIMVVVLRISSPEIDETDFSIDRLIDGYHRVGLSKGIDNDQLKKELKSKLSEIEQSTGFVNSNSTKNGSNFSFHRKKWMSSSEGEN